MTVYSAIKAIADSKNLTIYRIERDLNIANGTLSKWDKSVPKVTNLQKVADYLDVTMTYVLNKAKEEK